MDSAKKLSIALLLIGLVVSFFIAFNGADTNVKISMMAYAVVSAVLIVIITGAKGLEFSLVGDALGGDILKGFLVGGAFIVLNQMNSAFSLGAPAALLSLEAAFLVAAIVIVAPIVEEFLFRGLLYPFLYNSLGENNWVAMPLTGIIFAVFHFTVYGGFLALKYSPGLFVGAFMFGTVMCYFVQQTHGISRITTLETPIVAHAVFNAYLLNQTVHFLAVGGVI